jgi:ABC-type phosphate/phosphonate transport system substrate-binding protein
VRRLTRAVAVGAVLAATACSGLRAPAPTPSPKTELVLGLSPSRSSEAQVAAAQEFAAQLSAMTKTAVVVRPEPSVVALDADLAAGAVDLAWSDNLTYVALRRRHLYTPVLRAARCFPTYSAAPPAAGCKPQPGTPAIIICAAASPVPELADGVDWSALKGKAFAFEDASSLTGYVWPRYFLGRNHIDPDQDLLRGPPTPTDVAVTLAVYNGLAACGAISGDGRLGAAQIIPDVFERTKVVFVAPGNVPGDVVYLGLGRLPAAQARTLRDALLRLGVAPAASGAIQQLGSGATAMLPAADHDFDLLRGAVGAVNPRLIDGVLPASPTPSLTRR